MSFRSMPAELPVIMGLSYSEKLRVDASLDRELYRGACSVGDQVI